MSRNFIVTGNHRSLHGISDIIKILDGALPGGVSYGPFFKSGMKHIVIEDFSSRNYTNYLLHEKIPFVLVLSEFIKINRFGRLNLNKFGFKSNEVYLMLEIILYYALLLIGKIFPRVLLKPFHGFMYWRARERNLQKVLKFGNLQGILTLHPEIASQAVDTKLLRPDVPVFPIYPVIREGLFQRDKFDSGNFSVTTFGSMNKYRKNELQKLNKYHPLGVTHAIEIDDKLVGGAAETRVEQRIDVYFKNSKTWKFLSPVRFWRSLNKGIAVVYFGEESKDHPINRCATQLASYEDFQRYFTEPDFDKISDLIIKYNLQAVTENKKVQNILC